MSNCIWKHNVKVLYGVKPQPIEDLPQTCTVCGEKFVYSSDLVFCSDYKSDWVHDDGVEITELEVVPYESITALHEDWHLQAYTGNITNLEIEKIAHSLWENSGKPDGEQMISTSCGWMKLKDWHWKNATDIYNNEKKYQIKEAEKKLNNSKYESYPYRNLAFDDFYEPFNKVYNATDISKINQLTNYMENLPKPSEQIGNYLSDGFIESMNFNKSIGIMDITSLIETECTPKISAASGIRDWDVYLKDVSPSEYAGRVSARTEGEAMFEARETWGYDYKILSVKEIK